MGQQQLLLIILGVTLVGIAVVVGINLFSSNAAENNRNILITDLTHLANMAQQYYRKPVALTGGGNSFMGWNVNWTLFVSTIMTSLAISFSAQQITFAAQGRELGFDGLTKVKVTMVIGPNGITSTTINN